MGMFDDIEFEAPCQNCGELVTGFQSKDGDCVLDRLTPYELAVVGGLKATFYSTCDACDIWNEYTFSREIPITVVPLDFRTHPYNGTAVNDLANIRSGDDDVVQ